MRPVKLLEQKHRRLDTTASIESIAHRIHVDALTIDTYIPITPSNEFLYKMVTDILSDISYHLSLLIDKLVPSIFKTKNYTEKSHQSLRKIHKQFKRDIDNVIFAGNVNDLFPVYPGLMVSMPTLVDAIVSNQSLMTDTYLSYLKKVNRLVTTATKGSAVSDSILTNTISDIKTANEDSDKELSELINPMDTSDRRKLKELFSTVDEILDTAETILNMNNPLSDHMVKQLERLLHQINDKFKMLVINKRQKPETGNVVDYNKMGMLAEAIAGLSATVVIWYQLYQHALGTIEVVETALLGT